MHYGNIARQYFVWILCRVGGRVLAACRSFQEHREVVTSSTVSWENFYEEFSQLYNCSTAHYASGYYLPLFLDSNPTRLAPRTG